MAISRMEHVGIVVEDLAAATAFFRGIGLVAQGQAMVEGTCWSASSASMAAEWRSRRKQTSDSYGRLELAKLHSPVAQGSDQDAPANTPGLRHVAFAAEGIEEVIARLQARGAELVGELERYQDSYWLCNVRGPEGIIVELTERIG